MSASLHTSTDPTADLADAGDSVHVSHEVSAQEWNAFVRAHPEGTGYHLWEWRDVFQHAQGHATHYLAACQSGRITGVLPLAEVRSWMFGGALSSLPYVNYGGVLAVNERAARALLAEARRLAERRGTPYVLLRHRRRRFRELPVRTHKVTMLLPLDRDRDAMWTALDRKVRNQIRKADKSGLVVVSGGAELLDDFYAVFARNMRDLGTPAYGRALFASMLATFPADARLHVVRLGSDTLAGALSYAFGDTVEVPSASSLREHRALCPNHLLYWSIITAAIAEGRKTFDFGRSTPHDGTYQFKQQWGATPVELCWEYLLLGGRRVPEHDRQSSKYQALIGAWRRLPVSLTTRLGPFIARAVP